MAIALTADLHTGRITLLCFLYGGQRWTLYGCQILRTVQFALSFKSPFLQPVRIRDNGYTLVSKAISVIARWSRRMIL